jgi:hypothetical protein
LLFQHIKEPSMFPNLHRPILAAVLCLSLPACATLERHPVLTAVGTAIIVGSIAASAEHHHDQQHERQIAPMTPLCAPNCAYQ